MNTNLVSEDLVSIISKRVDYYFRELSKIPRGSGNERAIQDYLEIFANELHKKDERISCIKSDHEPIGKKTIYDIVIRKPGVGTGANLPVTILQAHIDMVCQKTEGSSHNFLTDPIELVVENGKMRAKDTTLGADDGIGVACIMAILESDDISHPPIEALFTSDEEDDMTGAMAVTSDLVKGKRLINIDTETEGIFYYGCAGGINANFSLSVSYITPPAGLTYYTLEVSGLLGGHSGIQIHEKHANANRLIGRALEHLSSVFAESGSQIYLAQIQGGDKKNVIAKNARAIVGIPLKNTALIEQETEYLYRTFAHEYEYVETDLKLEAFVTNDVYTEVLSPETLKKLISILVLIPNDVLAMHGNIPGLVETSCNLGVLQQTGAQILMVSFIRSFIESKKQFTVKQMRTLAELVEVGFSTDADFPNWEPNLDSELIKRFNKAYWDTFHTEAKFESIHAGLECGHFAKLFPDMDMIACGPTILGAHTTEETLYLDTVEKIVHLLLNVLLQMQEEAPENSLTFMSAYSGHECHRHICQCVI